MFLSKSLLKSPKYHLSGNVSALVRRAPDRFFDWVFSQYREKPSRCEKLNFCNVSDVSEKDKTEKPSFALIFRNFEDFGALLRGATLNPLVTSAATLDERAALTSKLTDNRQRRWLGWLPVSSRNSLV